MRSPASPGAVIRGASLEPAGSLVFEDVARAADNGVTDRLPELGCPPRGGPLRLEPFGTGFSLSGFNADRRTRGIGADWVAWPRGGSARLPDVRAQLDESFMTLARSPAGIVVVRDPRMLVLGAMVLGPGV